VARLARTGERSGTAVRAALVLAALLLVLVAALVSTGLGSGIGTVLAGTALALLVGALVAVLRNDRRRPAGDATLRADRVLWVLAAGGLLVCGWLAFGPRGDSSYRDDCRGSTLSAYVHPQPRDPGTGLDFPDLGSACNADAVSRVHALLVLLPLSLGAGAGASAAARRRSSG